MISGERSRQPGTCYHGSRVTVRVPLSVVIDPTQLYTETVACDCNKEDYDRSGGCPNSWVLLELSKYTT